MLLAEGNADDDDVEQNTKDNVHQAGEESSADKPNDIEGDADAAWGRGCASNIRTEGEEAEETNLEGLQGDRYADDGNCHRQTACEVTDGGFEATEDPPDDSAEEFHNYLGSKRGVKEE